jgi:hypothetical protein
MAKMLASLLARAAGVDPERLAGFGYESRQIVLAIGWSLVMVTFPLAFLAMAVYAGANLIAPGLEPATRLVLAGLAGFAYAMVIVIGVTDLLSSLRMLSIRRVGGRESPCWRFGSWWS